MGVISALISLISPEARRITPLMSKAYLALLVAPRKYWDRHGVLHFTGEQRNREWRTAWPASAGSNAGRKRDGQ